MKYVLKLIFLLIISSVPLLSQWRWMNPKPQGNRLTDVAAAGEGKFISVGNLGTIILSENFGEESTIVQNQYLDNLTRITRTPDGKLISIGQNGMILISQNEGLAWEKIDTPFNGTFWDICFINSSVGFIISYEGKILKSIDGGYTWNLITNPLNMNLFSISMVNENTGYISGNSGLIIKTIDGGNSWQPVTNVANSNILKISAVDENIVICGGQNDSVYKSIDGGNNWIPLFSSNNLRIRDIQFISPETGFILGMHDVYRTSDGNYFSRVLQTISNVNLTSIDYLDSANAFIVGEGGAMLKSTNNGFAWYSVSNNFYLSVNILPVYLKFFDINNGIILNYYGSIFRTTDSGFNFTQVNSNIQYIWGADFLNNNFGIAVGSSGAVYKTTNSGLSWTNCSISGNYVHFKAVEILDEDTAIAVADYSPNSGIFRSTSKGNYWNIVPTQFPEALNDVSFWNINDGIAVGENGLILKTTNAGKTWYRKTFLNNRTINRVICTGQDTIYLLVSYANIFKSTDGGNSFYMIPFSTTGGILQMMFKDSYLGLISGPNGEVYRTLDGGISWSDVSCRTYDLIQLIDIISRDQFAVGSWNGNLLMYDNTLTSVHDPEYTIPEKFILNQNYPNPFNPSTTISYQIPLGFAASPFSKGGNEWGFVTLKIYDVLGNEVAKLVDEYKPAGNYKVTFDASKFASGIYFYRLQAGSFTETKKMVLIK